MAMKFAAAILLSLAVAAGTAAAEEPEAAYENFHRAVLAGNFDAMLRYVPGGQRGDLLRLTPEQRDAQLKLMGALMPRNVQLRKKTPDGNNLGAGLVVSGPGKVLVGDKPVMMYGTIRMVMERGDWKVADVSWSNEQPEALQAEPQAAPKPAPQALPAAPAEKFVKTPARPKNAPPVVGSMDAAPERKLGTAKPPCEFKPVMTAEDLENCK
jgi:hypothetical protein